MKFGSECNMATKVDPGSSAEPQSVQSSIAMSTTAVSASSPKVSKFGSKAGFVIPKNKLSGSLIPIFRGGGKVEAGITDKEEGTKHIQRKTKWGPDLTQDATVRKGRALAYQTRVEQITQQLKSGALEIGDDQDLQSPAWVSNHNSGRNLLDAEPQKRDLLELERREVIGEILQLNPSYKAPPDYKPLLKEAKVPIPLKTYPGYNFIGLILGADNDTQKRLEKETGTKVRVLGTKADTGEKREIAQSDITDAKASYEDVYVHVSADTYEKVDAAVSLIELLFAPISANSVVASTTTSSAAGDSGSIPDPRQDSTSGYTMMSMGAVNHGVVPQMVMPVQPGPQQFQPYSGPWYPPSAPNVPIRPPGGFISSPMPNHSLQFPPSPGNPLNAPTFFGGHPGPIPRNSSPFLFRHQPPMQVLQRPLNQIPPSNLSMPSQQAPSPHPTMPPQSFSTPSQTSPVGMMPTRQPTILNQQPGPMAPGGLPPNRPLSTSMPLRNPWSSQPPSAPQSQRPSSMMQMASNQPMGPQRPPHLAIPQNNVAPVSSSPPNFPALSTSRPPATNFVPPPAFPSQPSTAPTAYSSGPPQSGGLSVPAMVPYSVKPLAPSVSGPTFLPSPVPRPLPISAPVSAQASMPTQSASLTIARPPVPVPSMAPPPVRPPQPPPAMPGSGLPIFSPVKLSSSPVSMPSAPKPQPPSSGDFTFQPLRAQTPFSPTTSGSTTTPSVIHNTSQVPLAAPQAPSFRPAVQNSAIPAGVRTYLRPQTVSQRGPPQSLLIPGSSPASAVPRPMNSPTGGPPLRHTPYPNPQHVSPPLVQANPPRFIPNFTSSVPVRPPTLMQPLNQMPTSRPLGLLGPSQQLSNNLHPSYVANKLESSPGGSQSYDPFSPTSISSSSAAPQQADDQTKARKLETDAEYEDLMASVGVR